MDTKFSVVFVGLLALSGCEQARVAEPIDPPAVNQSFSGAQKAEDIIGSWMVFDEKDSQDEVVEISKEALSGVFSDVDAWPDCQKLMDLSSSVIESSTFYGISTAPDHYSRAISLGCDAPDDSLAKVYEDAIGKIVEEKDIPSEDGEIELVSRYLQFKSTLGASDCSSHSLKVSREMKKPFKDAMASIEKDCSRPL